MKLNLAQELTTLDGKPMKIMMLSDVIATVIQKSIGEEKSKVADHILSILTDEDEMAKNATVGMVAFNAILSENEGTPEEKYKRGRLAEKVYGKKSVELDIEEVKLIKDMVGKHQNTTTIVRMWDILEKANK